MIALSNDIIIEVIHKIEEAHHKKIYTSILFDTVNWLKEGRSIFWARMLQSVMYSGKRCIISSTWLTPIDMIIGMVAFYNMIDTLDLVAGKLDLSELDEVISSMLSFSEHNVYFCSPEEINQNIFVRYKIEMALIISETTYDVQLIELD